MQNVITTPRNRKPFKISHSSLSSANSTVTPHKSHPIYYSLTLLSYFNGTHFPVFDFLWLNFLLIMVLNSSVIVLVSRFLVSLVFLDQAVPKTSSSSFFFLLSDVIERAWHSFDAFLNQKLFLGFAHLIEFSFHGI